MASFKKIARRGFLIGSAALAGGVAFGAYSVAKPAANPNLEDLREGQVTLNPWIIIDQTGVTLITPQADMGQGAYTVQAIMLAEELDIELDQISFSPGTPSKAYWNRGMGPEMAEFITGTDEGRGYEATIRAVNTVVKAMGMQMTGGSSTVPDGFIKLRQAGASARETLKLAASKKAKISVDELRTESGAVVLPDGTKMPYTELASDAASVDVVQDVPLRDPSEWRIIGKTNARLDMFPKVTGSAIYGADQFLEGMVYATPILPPARGAKLQSYDASEALSMRGVKTVLAVSDGLAVVADNSWRAFEAAKRVKCEWSDTSIPKDMTAHWDILSNAINEDNINSRKTDDGDVQAALDTGDPIEMEYRAPYLVHAPLEPSNALVLVNDDEAQLWTGTQAPNFAQRAVAEAAGIDWEKVKLDAQYIGGGFGLRAETEWVRLAAEVATQMKGTPVLLTYTREADMLTDFPRQIAMAKAKGTVSDGKVETLDLHIAMPNVIASQMGRQGMSMGGPDSQAVAGAWAEPFAIPNRRITGYNATGLAPVSSWRSVGASTNGFFYNSALDELIEAAGADPLEERLRLCDHDVARKVLEAVGEMSNWNGANLGANRGRGVAMTTSFGVPCAQVIDVSLTDQGIRIEHVYAAADVGTIIDPQNFEAQISGGVIWSIGHAINCQTTYTNGIPDQKNYHDFEAMRLYQAPKIEVRGLENAEQIRGIGEPAVPPAPPALASAIYAATGTRLREMPFNKFVNFV